MIEACHEWAMRNQLEFGGAIRWSVKPDKLIVFGEFPPNKFGPSAPLGELIDGLSRHLSETGLSVEKSGLVDLRLKSGEVRGVIGLRPGYGDAVPHRLADAEAAALPLSTALQLHEATIFYNYKDSKQQRGYACCDEPGVLLESTLMPGEAPDVLVRGLAAQLGQTSIHLVVGQETGPATHEAWKIKGQQTAGEGGPGGPPFLTVTELTRELGDLARDPLVQRGVTAGVGIAWLAAKNRRWPVFGGAHLPRHVRRRAHSAG